MNERILDLEEQVLQLESIILYMGHRSFPNLLFSNGLKMMI